MASTPLQPGSIETPNAEVVLRITLPVTATWVSKCCISQPQRSASRLVQGSTTACWTGASISAVNSAVRMTMNNPRKRTKADARKDHEGCQCSHPAAACQTAADDLGNRRRLARLQGLW
jgi:hypothetical protein